MGAKRSEYDVTVPFTWQREETSGADVQQWETRAKVALLNTRGISIEEFTAVPAPDLDDNLMEAYEGDDNDVYLLEELAEVVDRIERGATRWVETVWTGQFIARQTVSATSMARAISIVESNLLYSLEEGDVPELNWCRGPEVWVG